MKKIKILGLHLNYGGVEQAIINQANMLCDNYDVELVVVYKITDKPAFEVNKKVKIKYLTNVKPNKKEFLELYKNKNYIKMFLEGIKSIYILFKKKSSLKKYIKNIDADIVISSRIEITKILNKLKGKNIVKIAEEHVHHNNNLKYVNTLKKNTNNIDYLVSVSEHLNEYYKNIIDAKCIYIPNSLTSWPMECSKLNNKNIVSVGRLSKEKGFLDLIEVIKRAVAKDREIHLDLIGDGEEYNNIMNLIKKYSLEKNITLHGFQNQDYISEIYNNSSLYLMTSYEESFGIVLIEAGSHMVPAMAFSSAQGANEIIKNNKSGYLIENRNMDLMVEKILYLLNNRDALVNMGDEARKVAHSYSFEEVKKIWLNFLDNT